MPEYITYDSGHFIVPNGLFDAEGLDSKEKLVFAYLCRCGNNGSAAFPSYNTIAKKCSMSRMTAISAIKGLVEKGLLKKIERSNGSGDQTSNEYKVLWGSKIVVPPSKEDLPPPSKDVVPPSKEVVPYKELPINNSSEQSYIYIDDLEHVRITQKEFDKLKELLGSHSDVIDYLYRFESWIITQTPKKQKTASAYLSVRTWYRNDQKKGTTGKYVSAAEKSSNALNEALRKEMEQSGTGRRDITDEVYREDVQQLPSGRGENHRMGGLF